jgi:hypothetical protein
MELDTKATETFWNGVSTIYSDNEMTTHESDFEMDFVFETVTENKDYKPDILMCIGVADGSRDPYMILKKMKEIGYLPDKLIMNDISPEMINIAKERMKIFDIKNMICFSNPIESMKFDHSDIINDILYVIGVYSCDFLREGLELYFKNKEIIGEKFTIKPIYYCSCINSYFYDDNKIEFNIKDYDDICNKTDILKWQDDCEFVSYSITTDKNFTSHYFKSSMLYEVFKKRFNNHNIKMTIGTGENKRYILTKIKNNGKNNGKNIIVTILNNVIGNIISDHQLDALSVIKSIEMALL